MLPPLAPRPSRCTTFHLDRQGHEDDNFSASPLRLSTTVGNESHTFCLLSLGGETSEKSILCALVVLLFVAVGIAAAPPLTFTFSDFHANKTATETERFLQLTEKVGCGGWI